MRNKRILQSVAVVILVVTGIFFVTSCKLKGDLVIINMLEKDVNVHHCVIVDGYKKSEFIGVCHAHSTKIFYKEYYPSFSDFTDLNSQKVECDIQEIPCSGEICGSVVLTPKFARH